MYKSISVIITVRGREPYLLQTIKNIAQKIRCQQEIILVYDGHDSVLAGRDTIKAKQVIIAEARGVGPARHEGILKAKYPIIFLTDAHMDFSRDFGETILAWFREKDHKKDMTCGLSRRLREANGRLAWDKEPPGTGARFLQASLEPGGEKWAMSGKWAPHRVYEPIGCVFGAAYAFRKKWYKEIGSPLQLLTGWGMDEEYLSAASWLAGGRCILLDYEAAHLFREKPAFEIAPQDVIDRWLNRLRFLGLLPIPNTLRAQVMEWLEANTVFSGSEITLPREEDMRRHEVKEAMALWQSWDYTKLAAWVDQVELKTEQTYPSRSERPATQRRMRLAATPPRVSADNWRNFRSAS